MDWGKNPWGENGGNQLNGVKIKTIEVKLSKDHDRLMEMETEGGFYNNGEKNCFENNSWRTFYSSAICDA